MGHPAQVYSVYPQIGCVTCVAELSWADEVRARNGRWECNACCVWYGMIRISCIYAAPNSLQRRCQIIHFCTSFGLTHSLIFRFKFQLIWSNTTTRDLSYTFHTHIHSAFTIIFILDPPRNTHALTRCAQCAQARVFHVCVARCVRDLGRRHSRSAFPQPRSRSCCDVICI